MGNRGQWQLQEDGSFERVVQRPNGNSGGNGAVFAVCDSAGDVAAKEVVIRSNFTLAAGVALTLAFAETNTAEDPTLSINGGPAKPLLWAGTAPAPGELAAGIWDLTYYDGAWQVRGSRASQMPNTETWITESGEWVAPVTGDYEVMLIGGGSGAFLAQPADPTATTAPIQIFSGFSGEYKEVLVYLTKGEIVNVSIGAGGQPAYGDSTDARFGGITVFGSISTRDVRTAEFPFCSFTRFYAHSQTISNIRLEAPGSGVGGGGTSNRSIIAENPNANDGKYYGAGGGICYESPYGTFGGAGAPGAIYLCYHDPAKANSAAAVSTLSLSRKAARVVKPATVTTVNLYDPETGQGSVWREEDAPAQLARGLITQEAWQAICEQKAAEAHAAWLADPDTEVKRFRMLRSARDARLAATDYLAAPDYPLTSEQKVAVTIYRQALRDLPQQEGAPWDGGGELTPWPEMPASV